MHFLTKFYDLLSGAYKMLRPFSYCWLQRLYLKAKRILDLMNVEKLRRENIATHLQVLRYGIYFHNDLTIRVLCLPSMIHEHLMQRERNFYRIGTNIICKVAFLSCIKLRGPTFDQRFFGRCIFMK